MCDYTLLLAINQLFLLLYCDYVHIFDIINLEIVLLYVIIVT